MPLRGYENYLYVNTGTTESPTWTEVDLAKDVNVNKEKTEVDATTRSTARNGWTATEDGLKSLSIEFETLIPTAAEGANAGYSALETAFDDNGSVELLVAEGPISSVTPADAVKATCRVFGGNRTEPLNDMAAISYTCKNSATPVKGTVASGSFTPSGS